MTVKELIKLLKKCDEELPVCTYDMEVGIIEIKELEKKIVSKYNYQNRKTERVKIIYIN